MLDAKLQQLEAFSIATSIRENAFLFPWIESVHVLAIALVVGTISLVDLRLLGLASLDRSAVKITREVLPYTWAAFAVAATTGILLFSSNARTYAQNFYFQGKLVLLALLGLNMSIFHLSVGRDIAGWGIAGRIPWPARIAGGVSLVLERIRLHGPDILHNDLEIIAPKILTKPWKTTRIFFRQRARKFGIAEGVCLQGGFAERQDKDGNAVFVPVPYHSLGHIVAPD